MLLTRLTRKDANMYVLIFSCHFCNGGIAIATEHLSIVNIVQILT